MTQDQAERLVEALSRIEQVLGKIALELKYIRRHMDEDEG